MTEELIPFAMSLSDDDPRVRLIHNMLDDDALSKELGDDWRNLDFATACELSANKKAADSRRRLDDSGALAYHGRRALIVKKIERRRDLR